MLLVSFRVPEERGFRGTLQIRQHVDGPDLLPGSLPHHGHLCKERLSYALMVYLRGPLLEIPVLS